MSETCEHAWMYRGGGAERVRVCIGCDAEEPYPEVLVARLDRALALIRDMEWRGTRPAYADGEAAACPMCDALEPGSRHLWATSYYTETDKIAPTDQDGGPRHASDCKLKALLEETDG